MDVPAVYDEIKGFDGCSQLDDVLQLKYIMGHTHCNEVTAHDSRGDKPAVGMMVAGQGMEGCGTMIIGMAWVLMMMPCLTFILFVVVVKETLASRWLTRPATVVLRSSTTRSRPPRAARTVTTPSASVSHKRASVPARTSEPCG